MSQEQGLKDILEIVTFIKDTAASKDDLERFATKDDLERFATKDDLEKTKSDIMTHVDGFIVLHQKLDHELAALRSKYDRLEHQLQQVANHLNLKLQEA